ncbi:MAG: hypothetical protein ACP5G2_04895 [Candidatus Bipolaricaulaceae bacterium]
MKRAVSIAVALILMAGGAAAAQQASATASVSWQVLPFALISLRGQGAGDSVQATTAIPTPSDADLARGQLTIPRAATLHVVSNANWTVLVQALDRKLGTSHAGDFTWPLRGNLRVDAGWERVMVSARPQALASGGRGEHVLAVDYILSLPHAGLPAGDYQVTLLYTVTVD